MQREMTASRCTYPALHEAGEGRHAGPLRTSARHRVALCWAATPSWVKEECEAQCYCHQVFRHRMKFQPGPALQLMAGCLSTASAAKAQGKLRTGVGNGGVTEQGSWQHVAP